VRVQAQRGGAQQPAVRVLVQRPVQERRGVHLPPPHAAAAAAPDDADGRQATVHLLHARPVHQGRRLPVPARRVTSVRGEPSHGERRAVAASSAGAAAFAVGKPFDSSAGELQGAAGTHAPPTLTGCRLLRWPPGIRSWPRGERARWALAGCEGCLRHADGGALDSAQSQTINEVWESHLTCKQLSFQRASVPGWPVFSL
jgi:hypothetical protein